MHRQITNSSAIKGFDYEDQELTIYFTNGDIRTYLSVPKKTVDEFYEAKSSGQYFNLHIRDNFPHEER